VKNRKSHKRPKDPPPLGCLCKRGNPCRSSCPCGSKGMSGVCYACNTKPWGVKAAMAAHLAKQEHDAQLMAAMRKVKL